MKGNEILIVGLVVVFLIGISYFGSSISGNQPFEPQVPGGMQIRVAQCSDNIDNDLDGLTDLNDPGCRGKRDRDEYNCGISETITVFDGDEYLGEDVNDPDWVWNLRDLDQVSPTSILDPDTTLGPVIGIENDFVRTSNTHLPPGIGGSYDLPLGSNGQPYASINFDRLTVPSVDYFTIYVESTLANTFGAASTVPPEYQLYLSVDAGVIEVSSLGGGDGEHIFFLSDQIYNLKINEKVTVPGGSQEVTLVNVGEGGAIVVDVEGDLDTVPFREERTLNGVTIYNYLPRYSTDPAERSAIVYLYLVGETRDDIYPAQKIFLQYFTTNTIGVFYKAPDQNPVIRFARVIDETGLNHDVDIARLFSDRDYILTYLYEDGDPIPEGRWLNIWTTRVFPSDDGLGIRLGSAGEEFDRIGAVQSSAEEEELFWFYEGESSSGVSFAYLGLKDEDHRTVYGTILKNPSLHSSTDRVMLSVPVQQVKANVNIRTPRAAMINGGTPLGLPLTFTPNGFNWELDNSDLPGFQDTIINYNRGLINVHDELNLGLDSPSVETSLTSQDDDYQANVFMETTSSKIKYYYVFDNAVDVKKVSRKNPLGINFLGNYLRVVGYNNPNSLDIEVCHDGEVECVVDSDCEDGLFCKINTCVDGRCESSPNTCNDGLSCTGDSCNENLDICENADLCDDGNSCTAESCGSNGLCAVARIPSCCETSADCTNGWSCCTVPGQSYKECFVACG